jgi:hypothetical protein
MHPIGIHSPQAIEGLSDRFLPQHFLEARRRSWAALNEIETRLRVGMSEPDAIAMAADTLKELGSRRSWHRPIVRFGENTGKVFAERPDTTKRFGANEPYLIDIGPTWQVTDDGLEYEGDVGDTRVSALNKKGAACAEAARALFAGALAHYRERRPSGAALYEWLKAQTTAAGYQLLTSIDGHRLGDFPHHRFYKEGLTDVTFTPAPGLWMLEIHIRDASGMYGAFFEDLLW